MNVTSQYATGLFTDIGHTVYSINICRLKAGAQLFGDILRCNHAPPVQCTKLHWLPVLQ